VAKRTKITVAGLALAVMGILFFQNCDGGFPGSKKLKAGANAGGGEDTYSSGGPEFEMALPAGQNRQSSAAYDTRNKVYLVVTGAWGIKGNFVNSGDSSLTSGFMISESADYAGAPSAVYSPEEDLFLVAWYRTNASNGTDTVGRLLRYSGGQVSFLSSTFIIGNKTSRMSEPPSIAYAPSRHEFVVTWMAYESPGGSIQVKRVSASGQPIGSQIVVTYDGSWMDSPTIAYNSNLDEFLVFLSATCGPNACIRTVKLNSQAQPVGAPQIFRQGAGGTWLTNVVYVPSRQMYFGSWAEAPNVLASWIDANGTLVGGVIDVAPGYGLSEGTHMAYNRHSNSFMFVMHDLDSYYNLQVEVTAAGAVYGPYAVIETPGSGNYGPNITASYDKREWLVTTSNDYLRTIVRRIPPLQ
jgi:hypothetical protein